MRRGYTPEQAIDLYYGLANDAWAYWNRTPGTMPVVSVEAFRSNYGGDALYVEGRFRAVVGDQYMWDIMPKSSCMALTESGERSIIINADFLPYLWEDELINVILHELAHAHVGCVEQHNIVWEIAAAEIGAVPKAVVCNRSFVNGDIPWAKPRPEYVSDFPNLTCPTLALLS